MFESGQEQIKKYFKKKVKSRMNFTTDLWTSNQCLSYLALTCHFFNDDGQLVNIVVDFERLLSPHTGVNIGTQIVVLLRKWEIDSKFGTIVMDNASNNNMAMHTIKTKLIASPNTQPAVNGVFTHGRCVAHIFNLVAQDGLFYIKEFLDPSRLFIALSW